MRLDVCWVIPNLALGAQIPEGCGDILAHELGIRRVVDLRAEAKGEPDWPKACGIRRLHLPTLDLQPVHPDDVRHGVGWVTTELQAGERVLVHCEHGIGRSAQLVCCILIGQGYTPLQALTHVKARREIVSPSPAQLHAILGWAEQWQEQHGRTLPVETWDDLARVAYRHLPRHHDQESS